LTKILAPLNQSGAIVRTRASLFLVGLIVAGITILPHLVRAQSAAAPTGGLERPIGKVITAAGDITIEHAAAVVALLASIDRSARAKAGDLVYRGDVIQTGRDGKLDLTLTDGTTINISSNARMVLDEFVYDPNGTSNSTFLSLTRGTFNFVAGRIVQTGNMRVDTPVGTMGIRGTAPRVEIAENGTVTFSTLVEPSRRTGAPGAPPR
jgi:hypothetical protein